MVWLSLLLIPFFAICYRARGGFLPLHSTQAARLLYWATPHTLVLFSLLTIPVRLLVWGFICALLVVTFVSAFVSLLSSHGEYMNDDSAYDCLHMSQIGFMRSMSFTISLTFYSKYFLLMPIFGAASGLAYWIGWRFLKNVDSKVAVFNSRLTDGGSSWGELLTGAFIGLGYSICILLGG